MESRRFRRSIKLILPALQLKLALAFVGLSALTFVLQYLLLVSTFTRAANALPNDGLLLLEESQALIGRTIAVSAALILPLTLLVGILVTHRFAGPIHRFKIFLRQVIDGEHPGDCRLREGDELQDVCGLINQATASARKKNDEHERAEPSRMRAAG
ncbi:MAG TPA: hypothetical protein VM509_07230 [Planctomycetota bacterium]|nr:hypothetical protein [Planctomycetota bacterium]